MTAMDDYKRNLNKIILTYRPRNILELGVEAGISTEVFLSHSEIKVTSIDIMDCPAAKGKVLALKANDRWKFLIGDVADLVPKFQLHSFDMVFMDITYYDATGGMGSKGNYEHEFKCLSRDLKRCFNLLPTRGVLVANDYIRQVGERAGHRAAINDFAIELGQPFTVFPSRGGMAVFIK